MNSHLTQMLAAERSQDLRRAASSTRPAPRDGDDAEPARRPARIARMRIRFARLTARSAETRS
jgi:hypothetical protein